MHESTCGCWKIGRFSPKTGTEFLAVASQTMQRILIDYARTRNARSAAKEPARFRSRKWKAYWALHKKSRNDVAASVAAVYDSL
jgi:hypothetical protein